ncbi:HD-GYP domain-containing protein [Geotalea toluenoxydans]|uniref:HD-GYP domain-containing protein n=1 Tax=Geotalea toluenoxydans TaxID=421624 RepID=UPI0006D08DA4|nr:HD domain-containing phosphohydrolase [Geotalea toluenoxydans]
MGEFYVPVAIESIEPEIFPDVALFLKSGNNYVLYKSHGRNFDREDAARLMGNSVDCLYVRPADLEVITDYMENNAERLLKSDTFDSKTKGKIIYQTSINFVGDLFQHPEKVEDFDRSRRLIENLLLYLSNDKEALRSLETVMSYNYHTFVHSLQVTALSILLHSEVYLLSRDELEDVGIGTLLHDFGKIFVPQEILNKSGKLTETEIAQFKKHPEEGYRYLKEKTRLSEVSLDVVRFHHERNNGTGYPNGLKAALIPRSAQVCALCDLYCSLTIDRTGRKALPPHISINIIRQEMKDSFNSRLVDALEALVCVEEMSMPL